MIELERSADSPVRVRLDRPPVNAPDLELVQAITATIARAIEEGAPAVVLTGQAHCFCAGIDTKLVPTYTDEQRPAANGGAYAHMRRVLQTDFGRALYRRRQAMIEPVFGQTKFNRRIDHFQRRGRFAVRAEWRLVTATHNLLKLRGHQIAAVGA
jgi:enoyl-CoA hydratase/carnithine racemase